MSNHSASADWGRWQNRTKVGLKLGIRGSLACDDSRQNRTKVGLKRVVFGKRQRQPRLAKSNQGGIETWHIATGALPAARQNRTKVGLKRGSEANSSFKNCSAKSNQGGIETRRRREADSPIYHRQNRTKVGLKQAFSSRSASVYCGKIEPRWD